MREANPESKKGVNFKARTPEEEQINSDIKSLAKHLRVQLSDLWFETAIRTLKQYNWPPTPQTQLSAFQGGVKQVVIEKCRCGAKAEVYAKNLQTKEEYHFCKQCFSQVPMRYDAKIWRVLRKSGVVKE